MAEEDARQKDKQIHKLNEVLKITNERNEKMKIFNDNSKKIDNKIKAQRKTKRTTSLGYEGDNKTEESESFGSKGQNH